MIYFASDRLYVLDSLNRLQYYAKGDIRHVNEPCTDSNTSIVYKSESIYICKVNDHYEFVSFGHIIHEKPKEINVTVILAIYSISSYTERDVKIHTEDFNIMSDGEPAILEYLDERYYASDFSYSIKVLGLDEFEIDVDEYFGLVHGIKGE